MMSAKVRKIAETACWCVGLALIGLYFALRADGEVERRAAISSFMAAAASRRPPSNTGSAMVRHTFPARLTYGPPDKTHWSKGRIRAYQAARTTTNENNGTPMAILRIPRVGLEVPVYAADTARNMNRGAVLIEGTAAPDTGSNTAIAAHRDGYFRVLKDVVVGDVLTVQTLSVLQQYRVASLEIVKPTDISVLRQTRTPVVTLVTCYPFYFVGPAPRRYIVRAVAFKGSNREDDPLVRELPSQGKAQHHGSSRIRHTPPILTMRFQDWKRRHPAVVIRWDPIALAGRYFHLEGSAFPVEANAHREASIRQPPYSVASRPVDRGPR